MTLVGPGSRLEVLGKGLRNADRMRGVISSSATQSKRRIFKDALSQGHARIEGCLSHGSDIAFAIPQAYHTYCLLLHVGQNMHPHTLYRLCNAYNPEALVPSVPAAPAHGAIAGVRSDLRSPDSFCSSKLIYCQAATTLIGHLLRSQ